jgi:Ca-activated chloride channel family protein
VSRASRILGTAVLAACVCAWLATSPEAQAPNRRPGFVIEITQPANQSVVFGRTKIVADVQVRKADLVDRVEFLVGDEVVFVDREPPYECMHDFGEESRSWIIRAVAYHVEDVSVTDAVITRKVPFTVVERVNRVVIWVSATDKDDEFVGDLRREDFRVLEEGVEQEILEFYREDRPITMAILLDSSGSMRDKLEEVHEAASSFVDTLREEDRALVIDFDDKVFLVEDLTSDHEVLKRAITSTEAIGGTALYDVLHATYRKIGDIPGRRAIVLLSDGEDTASRLSFRRVLEEAKSNQALIYAIGLGGGGQGPRRSVLRDFAEFTGGRAFFVKKASELGEVYQRIAEELRTQYYIAYSTSNEQWDGRWMKIKVESEREDLDVRARRGYFAVRHEEPGG